MRVHYEKTESPFTVLTFSLFCFVVFLKIRRDYRKPKEKKDLYDCLMQKLYSGGKITADRRWSVMDGMLVGPSDSSGWLGTEKTYKDFVLRLEYWIDPGETGWSNSGIFIRADSTNTPWNEGYEIQIDLKDVKNPTGSIYNRGPYQN